MPASHPPDRLRTWATIGIVALAWGGAPLSAQNSAPASPAISFSGSLRTRVESWNWFGGSPDGEYIYPGSIFRLAVGQSRKRHDWQLELAVPFVLGLPERAVAPGALGPLGLGASYFSANGNRTSAAMLFPKQAFVRLKDIGGVHGQSLKIGRMEFIDGVEVSPKDPTLATLKSERIAHRLLGNFGFSHVGRSLDGVMYTFDRPQLNVTLVGARPTRGVFQVDGWGQLNVNVFYGAVSGQVTGAHKTGDWRVFALGYHDYRDNVLKVDNRALEARRIDGRSIRVGTFGGHYLRLIDTPAGQVDALAWAAFQAGSWGTLLHRAGAFAAEAGWQPRILPALRPWFRAGYAYGSGDGSPGDRIHGTFFQVLPTPRVYARFPFFNLMNTGDGFAQLIVRPSRRITIRTDAHVLRLADPNDLWYQGGGAFQPWTFGYAGRPSGGRRGLAALYDASVDLVITRRVTIGAYASHASGGAVPAAIYADRSAARFGYVEAIVRF